MPDTEPDSLSQISTQMDKMLLLIELMNKRDRLRTVGSFFRGIISIIPVIIFIWSTWYFFAHGNEILGKITKMATDQAINSSANPSPGLTQRLEELMKQQQN
ncbi:MAG: hypothetical protein JWM56_822 [Candidatus Peribacteria bacterium]|nr:hypothetical protein [Candidatus Peribacteria bacterium]